jgi:hypothetical protein
MYVEGPYDRLEAKPSLAEFQYLKQALVINRRPMYQGGTYDRLEAKPPLVEFHQLKQAFRD